MFFNFSDFSCSRKQSVSADDDFDVSAEHAIAVEATTGKVLYEKDATTPDGIASMTKILTVLLSL